MADSSAIRLDLLFDAEECYRAGECPWTFFAYPTSLASNQGLPPDADACRMLAELQKRGLEVAIWTNGITPNTSYFACHHRDKTKLDDALQALEASKLIVEDFCRIKTEELFALVAK